MSNPSKCWLLLGIFIALCFHCISGQDQISSEMCRSYSPNSNSIVYPECTVEAAYVDSTACLEEGVMYYSWNESSDANDRVVSCSAPYPIDVRLHLRQKTNSIILDLNAPEFRREVIRWSTSQYKYNIRIPFGLTYSGETSVRLVDVWNLEFPETRTFLIPGFKTSELLAQIDLSAKSESSIILTQDLITLPCVTTNGKFPEGVYRENESSIPVDGRILLFDRIHGFRLNVSVLDEFEGKYYCKSRSGLKFRSHQFLRSKNFTLIKLKGTLAKPEKKDVKLLTISRTNLTLECISEYKVHLNGTLNDVTIPEISTSTVNVNGQLIYSSRHNFKNLGIGGWGEISCSNIETGEVYFTWNIVISDLTQKSRPFWMRKDGKVAQCQGSAELSFKNIQCTNPTECEIFRICLQNDVSCSANIQNGGPCNYLYCKQMVPYSYGVISCISEAEVHSLIYFTGFDRLIYNDWRDAPMNALMRLDTSESEFYSRGHFYFTCKAQKMMSSGDLQWMLEFNNGSSVFLPDQDSESQVEELDGVITRTSIIYLSTSEISKVLCLAPVWNSNEWRNVSYDLRIKESIVPVITTTNTEQAFRIGTKDQSLLCEVQSFPVANITWTRMGNLSIQNLTVLYKPNSASLVFPEAFHENLTGEYICTATGVAGITDSKVFTVEMEEEANLDWLYGLGAVLFIGLIVGIIWVRILLRRAKEKAKEEEELTEKDIDNFLKGLNTEVQVQRPDAENIGPDTDALPYNTTYEINKANLSVDTKTILGSGQYGIVYSGKLLGRNEPVAIKTVKPNCSVDYFKSLLSELKLLIFIGKHPNIVEFIGAHTGEIKSGVLHIVLEQCPLGGLDTFLRTMDKQSRNKNDAFSVRYVNIDRPVLNPDERKGTMLKDLLKWSHQIADAMEYISSKKVIHADLAARNVLLSSDRNAKLTDFGLSRKLYNYIQYVKTKQEPLPWRWMAIESLKELTFSSKSDVWSFGILMWEIFTLGDIPYGGIAWDPGFSQKLKDGLRLPKPELASDFIYDRMSACWIVEPDQRPDFSSLKLSLEKCRAEAAADGEKPDNSDKQKGNKIL